MRVEAGQGGRVCNEDRVRQPTIARQEVTNSESVLIMHCVREFLNASFDSTDGAGRVDACSRVSGSVSGLTTLYASSVHPPKPSRWAGMLDGIRWLSARVLLAGLRVPYLAPSDLVDGVQSFCCGLRLAFFWVVNADVQLEVAFRVVSKVRVELGQGGGV